MVQQMNNSTDNNRQSLTLNSPRRWLLPLHRISIDSLAHMSDTVLSLDRSGADAMNMSVLIRLDSDIVRIVDTVSHVKMYERDGKEWVSL